MTRKILTQTRGSREVLAGAFFVLTLTGVLPAFACSAILGICETWGYWLALPIFGIPAAVAWRAVSR